MADETLASYQVQYDAIDTQLDAGVTAGNRAKLKGDIIGMMNFHKVLMREPANALALVDAGGELARA